MRFAIIAAAALLILTNGCVFRGSARVRVAAPRAHAHICVR